MEEGRWEDLKAAEREAAGTKGALDGVALALPALPRAQKLQKRAARHGFDWPDVTGPRDKVLEEIEEIAGATSIEIEEEAGDFLFAAVNLVRAYGVDAEGALRAANTKFERRFRAMEELAGGDFAERDLDAQEALRLRSSAARNPAYRVSNCPSSLGLSLTMKRRRGPSSPSPASSLRELRHARGATRCGDRRSRRARIHGSTRALSAFRRACVANHRRLRRSLPRLRRYPRSWRRHRPIPRRVPLPAGPICSRFRGWDARGTPPPR